MEISFENELGRVRFFGGGKEGNWHITDVSGLGLCTKNAETVSYYGEDGQETVRVSLPARVITLTAEVKAQSRNERAKITSEAMRILAHGGVLGVKTFRERFIDCYLLSASEGARDGNFRSFVFQFVCDNPYFRDVALNSVNLVKREDVLKGPFSIGEGIVLTKRFSGGEIKNDSDIAVRGKIKLSNLTDEENSVVIENATTGKKLIFNLDEKGIYEVDFDKRTIENESGENCIKILDDECYLSDFYIDVGENEIEVKTTDNENAVSVVYEYYKRYVEATD